jgi:hypothetical protein
VDGQTATLIATVGGFAVALAAFIVGALMRVESRISARVGRFEARIDAHMDRLEDPTDRLENLLARVENDVAGLRGRVSELADLTRQFLVQRAA